MKRVLRQVAESLLLAKSLPLGCVKFEIAPCPSVSETAGTCSSAVRLADRLEEVR